MPELVLYEIDEIAGGMARNVHSFIDYIYYYPAGLVQLLCLAVFTSAIKVLEISPRVFVSPPIYLRNKFFFPSKPLYYPLIGNLCGVETLICYGKSQERKMANISDGQL